MLQFPLRALTACALFLCFTLGLWAQTGTVSGTVTSATGGPVANATVELQNVSTGERLRTTSDASGNYRFENVASGTYRMSTSTTTMTGTTSSDILVDAARAKTVNITMQNPATTAPTTAALITVNDATPVQGLESPQLRNNWNTRDIQYLPSPSFFDKNGSAYGAYNLSLLSAGVANQNGLGPGRGPVVGGQRPNQNNFLVEGVDNNNRANPGPLVYVSPEATTEFVIYQNQFPPEYGHTTGGQLNNIIRTGTNQVHGGLYWFLQNRHLNAMERSFANQGLTENPRYDQNRFGGNVGFPIVRNSLFMYGSFEYVPLSIANTPLQPVFGPTAAGFDALSRIGGVSQTNLGVLRQYLPAATTATDTTTVNGVAIPIGAVPITGRSWQNAWYGTGALDWKAGNSDNVRARYVHNELEANTSGTFLPSFITPVRNRSLLANVSWYHNLGARGINELRVGYNRYHNIFENLNLVFPGLTVFPNISIQQDLNAQFGQGNLGIGTTGLNTYQLADNVNWTIGNHTLRLGVDARRYIGPLNFLSQGVGNYTFSNLQRFLLDQSPDVFGARSFGNLSFSGNQWMTYGYINDTWRVAPNFHLNLGLRYEYVSIPDTLKLQSRNEIASVPGVLEFRQPETQKNAFAPRVGLAWAPTQERNTVIRAGFGMNYDAMGYSTFLPSVPPGLSYTQFVNTVTPVFGFFGRGAILNQFPLNVFEPTVTPQQARAITTTYIPDQELPYTIQWDAGLQQTIANRFILDLRYLGVRGLNIPVQDVLNRNDVVTASQNLPVFFSRPTQAQLNALTTTLSGLQAINNNPLAASGFTNPIFTVRPDGQSWYHGLLVTGTQRFSGGFQMKANYTWSHLIDTVSGANLGIGGELNTFNARSPRQTSIYDRRHVASLTALWDLGGIGTDFNWVRDILANFTVSGTYSYQSPMQIPITSGFNSGLGNPFVTSPVFVNPNGVAGTGSGVTPLTNSAGQTVGYLASDPNAQFVTAGPGSLPNSGAQYFPGMRPINNFDVAAFKRFAVRDRFSLELHAQAYNVLNHAQYVPGALTSLGLGARQQSFNFLIPGSGSFGDATQVFSSHPRTLQVGLRFLW